MAADVVAALEDVGGADRAHCRTDPGAVALADHRRAPGRGAGADGEGDGTPAAAAGLAELEEHRAEVGGQAHEGP
ncbi:hypothetical protein, partial [Clavibacter michiganensis]|uniref:hypothetical protein n=1 Tax=Clavibacter michiganensis TaxID=28447 RepID=UPI00292CD913